MAQKNGKKTKLLNLVASLLVTAVLILVWHFVVPHVGDKTPLIRLISYSILLFNVIWIVDALLSFWKVNQEASAQETVAKMQGVYGLIGIIVFSLFAALIHPVVAVFFADSTPALLISGFSKSALTLVGFALLVQTSLHFGTKKLWTLISGAATFAVGLIFSTFCNLNVVAGIMCAVVAVFFFVDVFLSGKKLGVSPIRFTIWEVIYVGVLVLELLIIHFIPIHLGIRVATFSVRAVVDLAFALVIDAAFLIAYVIARKKANKTK